MNTTRVLSSIAIGITITNIILIINNCHSIKNVDSISLELIFISLFIAIIWSTYGYRHKLKHIFFGNIIIILLMFFLLFLYYKYS